MGNVSETPTPTTCLKSTAVHLQFVRQYAPHLYRRTFLASKLRRKGNPAVRLPFVLQYASHLCGSTPPICTAVLWKNTGGWGHRNVSDFFSLKVSSKRRLGQIYLATTALRSCKAKQGTICTASFLPLALSVRPLRSCWSHSHAYTMSQDEQEVSAGHCQCAWISSGLSTPHADPWPSQQVREVPGKLGSGLVVFMWLVGGVPSRGLLTGTPRDGTPPPLHPSTLLVATAGKEAGHRGPIPWCSQCWWPLESWITTRPDPTFPETSRTC